MKLLSKKEDKLNSRIVYELEMEYSGQKTPDRKMVLEIVNKELRIDKSLMIIKKIKNVYGKSLSKIIIHAYNDRKSLENNEPKHLIKRITFKEEEKTPEQAPPANEAK